MGKKKRVNRKYKARVIMMSILYEYDAKKQRKYDREEGREEGLEEGREEGIGSVIRSAMANGKTPEEIADFTGISLDEIKKYAND